MEAEEMYWELFELAMRDFDAAVDEMINSLDKVRESIKELRDYTQTSTNEPP